ncbi:MAG: hypothetical protein HY960_01255 [Ignavibacteriae bacterium]|nr:hypothetical protein [Ignavibacteriota bacterium]
MSNNGNEKNVFLLLALSLMSISLFSLACEEEELKIIIPPHVPTIAITVDDVGVTEAWLKIGSIDSTTLGNIMVKHDTTVVLTANVTARETIVVSEQLLPNKHYTFKTYKLDNTTLIDSSLPLNLTTIDTTSHDFTWTFDTLGDGNASILHDVCIVNDTLAYAVGDIEILDTSNNFVQHNLVVWNGKTWEVKRMYLPRYGFDCSLVTHRASPLYSVFQFPSGRIIFSDGSSTMVLLGDTTNTNYPCMPAGTGSGTILKIWGVSENDFYCIGRRGTLIRYLNGVWKKLESGTGYNVEDIWGAENPRTKETEILAITTSNPLLLKIEGETSTLLSGEGLRFSQSGIWFVPGKKYFIAGDGLFAKNSPYSTEQWREVVGTTNFNYYREAIRGNGLNDFVVVCHYGDIFHFNGFTWKSYRQITYMNGVYYRVAMKGNIVIAVGRVNNTAIIATGKRK